MLKVSFEKTKLIAEEEEDPFSNCDQFKYIVYLILGYPYYFLETMNPFKTEEDFDKPWEFYKCE